MATTGVYFEMTDNIDLSDYDNWTPIGSDRNQFDGVFDGDGYVIDNLTSLRGGLFGTVCQNAVIKNVGVASGEIGKEKVCKDGRSRQTPASELCRHAKRRPNHPANAYAKPRVMRQLANKMVRKFP